jgi:hypothetical protein
MSRPNCGERPELAPLNRLSKEIQAVLSDGLIEPKYRSSTRDAARYDGHCYAASEAYFHLAGGVDARLKPMQCNARGASHWWLLDRKGRVIDLTVGPKDRDEYPYEHGTHRSFLSTPTGMSWRAGEIIERVQRARARRKNSGSL